MDYVAGDNPIAAVRLAEKIDRAVSDLVDFPERGRPGNLAGRLELIVDSYVIIYRYNPSKASIEVSEIWHQRQDRP